MLQEKEEHRISIAKVRAKKILTLYYQNQKHSKYATTFSYSSIVFYFSTHGDVLNYVNWKLCLKKQGRCLNLVEFSCNQEHNKVQS